MLKQVSKKAKTLAAKRRYPLPDLFGPHPRVIPRGEGDLPDEDIQRAIEDLFRERAAATQTS